MLLDLTSDQEFLRETTTRFLGNEVPVSDVRKLRDNPDGFDRSYWRRGAELGWTSFLVDEKWGGGSVSGRGLIDLTLIAHEFGRHAAPGPLLPVNLVAAALSWSGTEAHRGVLGGLVDGTGIASWCYEEDPGRNPGEVELEIRVDGAELVLDGSKRPVEAAAQAEHLLVTGRTGSGLTQVLVPAGSTGVSVTPLESADLTRRFYRVGFDEVRIPLSCAVGDPGSGGDQVDRLLQHASVIQSAESVGAMERGFEMTVEWAFDRYSFGRPLASYQALKHRFADMKSWLEAGHAIADAAADSVDSQASDSRELASAAKAFIGQYGAELLHDCVQIHGGIGVTFEHDLHLFLRRMAVNRMLYGTPAQHRSQIADIVEQGGAGR
ncbi:MAG TPA: acyl-CoA dehydrogenase family protein [Acidimicrobiales bacterium]|nr:acyl-CoA dehydrogenase family protein [Acidimicrobiales bacterium]